MSPGFAEFVRADPQPNLKIGPNAPTYGGGVGVVNLQDATVAPTTNPTGGGILYSLGGALFWRNPAGVVTPIAP